MKILLLVLPIITLVSYSLPNGHARISPPLTPKTIILPVTAGILPDSRLYILDNLGKSISLLFTIGADAKAEKALNYSAERLLEASDMAALNKPRGVITAAHGYQHFIEIAVTQADNVRQELVTDIDESVAAALAGYLEDLDSIEDQTPDASRDAIDALNDARATSITGLTNVLSGLALDKPELAAEIDLKAAQTRLYRAKDIAWNNRPILLIEALKDGETLFDFGTQIAAMARQYNSGAAAVEARISQAIGVHYDLLISLNESLARQPDGLAKTHVEDALKKAAARMPRVKK